MQSPVVCLSVAMRPLPALLSLTVTLAGCASDGVPFRLHSRPGFSDSARTVSIFGVFKDGQMTSETENALGPAPWAFLGNACDIAYGPALIGASPDLAMAVESYTRANGITDDLLELFVPAAGGELIMVVTMAGHVETSAGDAGAQAPSPPPPPPSQPRRGGGRGNRGGTMPMHHAARVDRGVLEFSASFFSVEQRRSVAIADTSYVGPSPQSAWKTFSTKLGAAIPGAACRGWHWERGIDGDRLRRVFDESAASGSSE